MSWTCSTWGISLSLNRRFKSPTTLSESFLECWPSPCLLAVKALKMALVIFGWSKSTIWPSLFLIFLILLYLILLVAIKKSILKEKNENIIVFYRDKKTPSNRVFCLKCLNLSTGLFFVKTGSDHGQFDFFFLKIFIVNGAKNYLGFRVGVLSNHLGRFVNFN